ncbi:MAG TPA: sigma-54 dependent transcriptional regulator [Candidatus Acidoferrales bacterium]|nr:sigma-54 dependent transcriptional regulator [Candidatus Acidoferrales bacterium]
MTAPSTATPANQTKGRILVVDDESDIREGLELLLTSEGYSVDLAQNGTEGIQKLSSAAYDLALLDLMMPDKTGMEVLEEVRKHDRDTPIFMITAYGSVEAAVSALKLGANDYFSKPWDNEKLMIEIGRMIAGRRLEYENTHLKRALVERYSFPNIIGRSEGMVRLLDLVSQVASSRSTILITGETGTGKELVAKAIHANSPRAGQMFVPVNSGSLPPDLLESTLFGHTKGAFTSAVQNKKGYFEVADKGTIFFDEIGTLGPETQIKMLRVIQEKEFIPLGATDPIKVDVRILAATNADLAQLVKEGRFREDLYYRLNVINIVLPPLRDRKEDIPLLVGHFFDYYCRENGKFLDARGKSVLHFEPEALQILKEHNWPGNVRELENVCERAVVLASGPTVPVHVLPDALLQANGIRLNRGEGAPLPDDASLFEIVNDYERRIIQDRLEKCSWSQTEAAESLHVPLSTLNQKIKRLDIKIRKKGEG